MQRNRREARYNRAHPVYPKPRLLYRHLLKQARRLEDPAARYFFQTQTRLRFRHSAGHSYSMVGSATQARRDLKLNDAMYHLARLTRANLGLSDDLEYVVGMTYGLIGPVVSEREKYRSLLNFKPNNFRLFPLPVQNGIHLKSIERIGLCETERRGLDSHHPKINIPTQYRLKRIHGYKRSVLKDGVPGSVHLPTQQQHQPSPYPHQTQKIHSIISAKQSVVDCHPNNHPNPLNSSNPTQDPTNHANPANSPDLIHHLQHLITNDNPLELSPYVYQPFRYGQQVALPDPMSAKNNSVIKKHSALQQFRTRIRRVWNPSSQSSPHNSILATTATAATSTTLVDNSLPTDPPHLSLIQLPPVSPLSDSLSSSSSSSSSQLQNQHPLTVYSTKHPVHPRVLLSFEYQLDQFMYSLLYFLSTRSASLRNAFRAWPDFGWVPLEQEAYDRVFNLKDPQKGDELKDPRKYNREHIIEMAQNQPLTITPQLIERTQRFGSELNLQVKDDIYTIQEDHLDDLTIALNAKQENFLIQQRVIPSALFHKTVVPKNTFDFSAQHWAGNNHDMQ